MTFLFRNPRRTFCSFIEVLDSASLLYRGHSTIIVLGLGLYYILSRATSELVNFGALRACSVKPCTLSVSLNSFYDGCPVALHQKKVAFLQLGNLYNRIKRMTMLIVLHSVHRMGKYVVTSEQCNFR